MCLKLESGQTSGVCILQASLVCVLASPALRAGDWAAVSSICRNTRLFILAIANYSLAIPDEWYILRLPMLKVRRLRDETV